jgi:hypothetical protein
MGKTQNESMNDAGRDTKADSAHDTSAPFVQRPGTLGEQKVTTIEVAQPGQRGTKKHYQ